MKTYTLLLKSFAKNGQKWPQKPFGTNQFFSIDPLALLQQRQNEVFYALWDILAIEKIQQKEHEITPNSISDSSGTYRGRLISIKPVSSGKKTGYFPQNRLRATGINTPFNPIIGYLTAKTAFLKRNISEINQNRSKYINYLSDSRRLCD